MYVGIQNTEFSKFEQDGELSPYTATGASLAIASNRISHHLGLAGPALSIDTACSSSLVALDVACKGLASGDC